MLKTIHKQPFEVSRQWVIEWEVGSEIIHVDYQGDQPTFWYTCDPRAQHERRILSVVGTGDYVDTDRAKHVGTILSKSGFVWHVFLGDK